MPDSTEQLEKNHANNGGEGREDSEYVRLVIPNELRIPEVDGSESQTRKRKSSLVWLLKTIIWCSVTVIILLTFVKWGVPFLVEKVFKVFSLSLFIFFFFSSLHRWYI